MSWRPITGRSINPRTRRPNTTYEVKYRGADERWHYKNFRTRREAEAFDEAWKRARERGESVVDLIAGRTPLSQWVEEAFLHWAKTGGPGDGPVMEKTLTDRRVLMRTHFWGTELAQTAVGRVTKPVLQDWADEALAAGAGREALGRVLGFIRRGLERAQERNAIGRVPKVPTVGRLPKPKSRRAQDLVVVETIRLYFLRRSRWALAGLRHALIVSLIAYAGLRPGEVLALEVEDLHLDDEQPWLYVSHRVSAGERVEGAKSHKHPERRVDLFACLVRELREFLLASGIREGLLFPAAEGGVWQEKDWETWRSVHYRRWAKRAGATDTKPYSLRHTYGSLLLKAGYSLAEPAEAMGDEILTISQTYLHVLAGLRGQAISDPNAAIIEARNEALSAAAGSAQFGFRSVRGASDASPGA